MTSPIVTNQVYTSAKTSINSSKLPAIFKLVKWESDTVNADVGGGKFDNATEFLSSLNVKSYIYDPYNRSAEHNNSVCKAISNNDGTDTTTCSNVLNVIAEKEARKAVILNCYNFLKENGTAYFTVYEGNKSGEGKETTSGYQLNQKTEYYVSEIKTVFRNVTRKGKLIIATR